MFYGYVRKSVEGNTELSLDVQESYLREQALLLKQNDITIIREIGSGASVDSRPKFKELIENCKTGDIIGCYDSSRFGRNTEDALKVASLLQIKGVRLHIAGKFIDVDSPVDKMLWTITAGFDTYQREIQNKKSKEGIVKQYEDGLAVFNGSLCGYDLSRKGKTPVVKVIPEEAKIIKYIFNQYIRGRSAKQLGLELYGTPNPRGHVFDACKVRRILLNPIYIGKYPNFRGKSRALTRYTRSELESKLVDSKLYTPIIDEDTFWLAFEKYRCVREKYSRKWETRFTTHEVSGIIRCCDCGKPVSHFTRDEKTMIRSCYIMHSHLKDCHMKRTLWDETWLERIMRLCFYIVFNSGDEIGSYFSERQNELYEDKTDLKEAVEAINKSISEVQKKIDRIVDAISEGIIDLNVSKQKMEALNNEIKSYEDKKHSLENDLMKIEADIDAVIELSAEQIIEEFPNNVREYYKKFIKDAINYKDRVEIEYNNGKKFTVHHPIRHGHIIDPVTVKVEWTNDSYQFVYTLNGPQLVKCGVEVYDNYIQDLLTKAWNETITYI